MSEIMTAKDLCLWYGDKKALKDINIAIPEKEYHGADRPFRMRQVHIS